MTISKSPSYVGDINNGEIELLESPVVLQNKYVTVYNDNVRFPSGVSGTYLRLEWPAPYSVGVVAITTNADIILVHSFRHAIRSWCWEIPKGFGVENTSPADVAARELQEESGYTAETYTEVGTLHQSPAIIGNPYKVVLATNAVWMGGAHHDATEAISSHIRLVPIAEYETLIRQGQLLDSLTISAIQVALVSRTS